jgi:DNA-binding response OmpR family regulator
MKRIVVIEDEKTIGDILATISRRRGYEIEGYFEDDQTSAA